MKYLTTTIALALVLVAVTGLAVAPVIGQTVEAKLNPSKDGSGGRQIICLFSCMH